ncbi:RSP_7527 family protein [Ruixingdingia sedimenti]|uniref:Uncharacterized protein n=1 Tax=Ruixingdingia sedimenti TaxID=3073604 RepID=A0ABU1F4L6_9RHOB|nr:hypothetical protein [Xinfangfangia sp. LG-4]MDR5651807.1 hypothetical protein [Xinfangfangia sp. LG-4]
MVHNVEVQSAVSQARRLRAEYVAQLIRSLFVRTPAAPVHAKTA